MIGRWHHGVMSRLDGEKLLKRVYSKYQKNCWLARVSPATELAAISKVYPADLGVSKLAGSSLYLIFDPLFLLNIFQKLL